MRKLENLNQLVRNKQYLVIREGKEYKGTYSPVKLGVSSGDRYPTTGLKRFLVLDSSERFIIKATDKIYCISD